MEAALLSGVAAVGQGILSNAISDLYNSIKKGSSNTYFSKTMIEIDIHFDTQIIEALLMDVEKHKRTECFAIKICVDEIHNLIEEIKNKIEDVRLDMDNTHYNRVSEWPSLWGSSVPDYEPKIKEIKKHKNKLDKRVDLLIRLMSMKL